MDTIPSLDYHGYDAIIGLPWIRYHHWITMVLSFIGFCCAVQATSQENSGEEDRDYEEGQEIRGR